MSKNIAMNHKFLIKTLPVGQLSTNCYIVADQESGLGAIVDPGDDAEFVMNQLQDLNIVPKYIIATHGHFDHILGAFELQTAFGIPFFIHTKDIFLVERMQETATHFLKYSVEDLPPQIDGYLEDGQEIKLGDLTLTVMHTPGHTPGSLCIYCEEDRWLITGDTIFARRVVGRTDFSYGSRDDLQKSIRKILTLPQNTVVYPGHGERTTIGKEKNFHTN